MCRRRPGAAASGQQRDKPEHDCSRNGNYARHRPDHVQAIPSTPRPYAHSPLNCTKTQAAPAHTAV